LTCSIDHRLKQNGEGSAEIAKNRINILQKAETATLPEIRFASADQMMKSR
jgi:hypothetical protein